MGYMVSTLASLPVIPDTNLYVFVVDYNCTVIQCINYTCSHYKPHAAI